MDLRRWYGAGLIILGVVLATMFWFVQVAQTSLADQIVSLGGECVTDEGCIHEDAQNWFVIGLFPSFLVVAAGVMVFFVRPDTAAIQEVVLRPLLDDERAVLLAVREDDGILQSTLKFRVGYSKSKVSAVLSELERRGLVTREPSGTTYKVYAKSISQDPS